MNNVKNINFNLDSWTITTENKQLSDFQFHFKNCPNEWFKNNHKQVIWDALISKKLKTGTVYRYHTALLQFYDYLQIKKIHFNDLRSIKNHDIEMFIFHCHNNNFTKSNTSVCLAALKWFIKHGRLFGYDGFPIKEIFSGEEFKMIKKEDTLTTKAIPTDVLKQIEKALKLEKNTLLKSIIEIGLDTGLRLSECLSLTTDSLIEDFTGKPLLHIVSSKNNSDRYIPVSSRVKKAFLNLKLLSEKARNNLNTNVITVYKSRKDNTYYFLKQSNFRQLLNSFVSRNNITDESGSLYPLTFHAFRHTLGTQMLNKGMSIFEIQDYLGHDSLHSTSIYAKLKNPTLVKEYNKLGFIGVLADKPENIEKKNGSDIDKTTLKTAALPDGICGKPLDNEGNFCSKYNMCLLCPKFITTPKHLDIHKNHLQRIKKDKERYMADEYIGSIEHLEKIEFALETVISKLEEMSNGTK